MEYIEITIPKLSVYANFLEAKVNKVINQSMEKEEILKLFKYCKHILSFFPKNDNKNIETVCNDIYSILRRIQMSLQSYLNGSVMFNEKYLKDFKQACNRHSNYIKEIYSDFLAKQPDLRLNDIARQEEIADLEKRKGNPFIKAVLKVIKPTDNILLDLNQYKSIPKNCEHSFSNLIQYKDEVYYLKTEDLFNYFYFYRTNQGVWFWSPPKKEDKEDIWIQAPNIQIIEGHWKSMKIPNHIEEFIIWLDIFSPNIPEFYLKKEEIKEEPKPEIKVEKVEEKKEVKPEKKKDKCVIF